MAADSGGANARRSVIALIVMCFSSGANTTIALCLGRLVDAVNPELHPGLTRESLTKIAAIYLAVIGVSYLVREVMNVLRRFLVEDACTRIDKECLRTCRFAPDEG